MKNLFTTFITAAFLSMFSVSAFAEGVDLVSTEGAICSEREAGKAIKTKSIQSESEGTKAASN